MTVSRRVYTTVYGAAILRVILAPSLLTLRLRRAFCVELGARRLVHGPVVEHEAVAVLVEEPDLEQPGEGAVDDLPRGADDAVSAGGVEHPVGASGGAVAPHVVPRREGHVACCPVVAEVLGKRVALRVLGEAVVAAMPRHGSTSHAAQ
jgi:hypothetical protein